MDIEPEEIVESLRELLVESDAATIINIDTSLIRNSIAALNKTQSDLLEVGQRMLMRNDRAPMQ